MSFKITWNKVLFIVVCIIDTIFLYQTYDNRILFWFILLPVFIPVMLFFKIFHFLVCYRTINRKNVNFALFSLIVSVFYKMVYFMICFVSGEMLSMFLLGIVATIDFTINLYFAATIYFMKSLLYFDINVPVDGYGIGEKVDTFANAIPGL